MLIHCPLCGPRDRREFYFFGADDWLNRPTGGDVAAFDDYLHNRANPAGDSHDLWYHEGGCAQWLRVHRNTVTHGVHGADLVAEVAHAR
jgi:sarcosine oxidase subunit delta